MKEKVANASIPKKYADAIDELVKSGEYVSRNEFVRDAVRDKLIARDMLRVASLKTNSKSEIEQIG